MSIVAIANRTYDTDKTTAITLDGDNDAASDAVRDLTQFPHLLNLSVTNNSCITDLECFAPILPRLPALNLRNCQSLRDISALTAATSLSDLCIDRCNNLTDLSALRGSQTLSSFAIMTFVGCVDLSPLADIPTLAVIDVTDTADVDFGTPRVTPAELNILKQINFASGFDMRKWHSDCGTAHCLAGWAQIITGEHASPTDSCGERWLPSLRKYFYCIKYTRQVREMCERIIAAGC